MGKNIFYEHNKDSVFFTSLGDSKVYLYDGTRNEFDTLFSLPGQTFNNLQVAYVNNKFHIMGDDIYLENTDRSDLTKWASAAWDYGSPKFYRVIFKDNFMFAEMSDSLRPRNNYRIEFLKPVDVEETYIETYPFNIFPNPSTDFISFDTDNENCLGEIYNIMGIKQMETPYTKEINISSLASGVYFIHIKHGNNSRVMKLIVGR